MCAANRSVDCDGRNSDYIYSCIYLDIYMCVYVYEVCLLVLGLVPACHCRLIPDRRSSVSNVRKKKSNLPGARVGNAPRTSVHKKVAGNKPAAAGAMHGIPKTGDGCSAKPWTPWTMPDRPDRVQKRVENKNFYLNGKNQQMQRKTI